MPERKVTVQHQGKQVEALEIPVDESTEKWSEFKLSDGTILRTKMGVGSAARIPGEYDSDGHPIYVLTALPQMIVIDSDPSLRKKKS